MMTLYVIAVESLTFLQSFDPSKFSPDVLFLWSSLASPFLHFFSSTSLLSQVKTPSFAIFNSLTLAGFDANVHTLIINIQCSSFHHRHYETPTKPIPSLSCLLTILTFIAALEATKSNLILPLDVVNYLFHPSTQCHRCSLSFIYSLHYAEFSKTTVGETPYQATDRVARDSDRSRRRGFRSTPTAYAVSFTLVSITPFPIQGSGNRPNPSILLFWLVYSRVGTCHPYFYDYFPNPPNKTQIE
ncbi:hypothetical protein GGS26DRAFT_398944 [Hypomontagnella submonticulosa]|nr:hypothetical protein GGS26DRAFT_398944 [Hypomontagnella submonticulosa]